MDPKLLGVLLKGPLRVEEEVPEFWSHEITSSIAREGRAREYRTLKPRDP